MCLGRHTYGNVYLDSNVSLAMMTGMVTQTMMSQPMRQKILSAGSVASYTVAQTDTGDIRFPSYTQPTLQAALLPRALRLSFPRSSW